MIQKNKAFLMPLFIFLLIWLILNVFTAATTTLYSDEAYYWMYSKFLDWGYFDHPPGVALAIKFGTLFGKSELLVRLGNIIATACSISIIYVFTKPKHPLYFFLSLFSFLVLHLVGFVSLPDGVFLLSTLLFFIAYKRFLGQTNYLNSILLAASIAIMFYCKYHGVLIVFFTVLSNIKLLKNPKTYLVAFFALVFFVPHIYWQISNNFPSITFHLVDRAEESYEVLYTLKYLLGNLPFMGGFISIMLLISAVKYKTQDYWEKALWWNMVGIFVFFFLITFKAQNIEPNWTLFCAVPMLVLGYKNIENSGKYFETYKKLVWIGAMMMVIVRIHLQFPLILIEDDRVWDFHGAQEIVDNVNEKSGDKIICANRYQDASLLNFYLNKPYFVPSLNINSRANQYSIWKFENSIQPSDSVVFVNDDLKGEKVVFGEFQTKILTKEVYSNITSKK